MLGKASWACGAAGEDVSKVHTSVLGDKVPSHALLGGEGGVTERTVLVLVLVDRTYLEAYRCEGVLLVGVDGDFVVVRSCSQKISCFVPFQPGLPGWGRGE